MKNIIIGYKAILAILLIFAFPCDFIYSADNNRLDTRYGSLEIVSPNHMGLKQREGDYPEILLLNGHIILRKGLNYLSFTNYFKIGVNDIVVISHTLGGSGSKVHYMFLVLKKNSEYKLIENSDLFSDDYTYNVNQKDDSIIIDLGYSDRRRKTAVFKENAVLITYKEEKKHPPLDNGSCNWLYLNVLRQHCFDYRGKCEDSIKMAPMSIVRGLNSFSNNPSFNMTDFEDLCIKTCNRSIDIQPKEFSEKICHQTPAH